MARFTFGQKSILAGVFWCRSGLEESRRHNVKYKNEKTGAVIDVSSNISGGNWKPLVENDAEDKKKAPGRKRKQE